MLNDDHDVLMKIPEEYLTLATNGFGEQLRRNDGSQAERRPPNRDPGEASDSGGTSHRMLCDYTNTIECRIAS
ncbi:unnamed protein product, partial [Mesorhabditis spiculigera]